jgi:hypothetical protein
MSFDHKHGNIYLVSIHLFSQKCKINIFVQSFYFSLLFISEQETIDVERKLRYDFMCERCQKEMPEERK